MYHRQSTVVCGVIVLCIALMCPQQQCLSAALKQDEDKKVTALHQQDNTGECHLDCASITNNIASMGNRIRVLERYASQMQQASLRDYSVSRAPKRERDDDSGCPVGTMKYGRKCLLFVHDKKSMMEADSYCASMTSKLVTIDGRKMQSNIKKFLKAQLGGHLYKHTSVYTGLVYTHHASRDPTYNGDLAETQSVADGWYWQELKGKRVTPLGNFTDWAEDHPRHDKTVAFPESCMHLDGSVGMKWKSAHCTVERYFICEFRAVRGHGKRRKKKGRGRKNKRGRNERQKNK